MAIVAKMMSAGRPCIRVQLFIVLFFTLTPFLTQEKGGFVRYVVVDVLLLLLINHMVPHVINQIRGNKGGRKSQPNSGKNSIIVGLIQKL